VPYANLIVAQGASAWFASPYLVALGLTPDDPTFGPYFFHIVAAVGALIICICAWVGSRISKSIRRPTFLTVFLSVAFAIAGTHLALAFLAPYASTSMAAAEIFTVTPVAAAILGYLLHRGIEVA
jgi:drug/metabolite transporter (DMT)-like permease